MTVDVTDDVSDTVGVAESDIEGVLLGLAAGDNDGV